MSRRTETEASTPGDPGGTRVIKRAAGLMRLLADKNRHGMRLMDLVRSSGIERSTAHRLLQGLVEEGLAFQDKASKRYFLGMAVYEMGVAVPAMQLRDLCHPYLRRMARKTGDTNFLSVRSGFDGVCVDRNEGGNPVSYVLEAGRRRPLALGSSNLAILAALPPAEVTRICRENLPRLRARFPGYSDRVLGNRIDEARSKGYVLADVVEKLGVRALARCIRDAEGQPIGAVSISALAPQLEGDRLQMLHQLLTRTIADIEEQLRSTPIATSAF